MKEPHSSFDDDQEFFEHFRFQADHGQSLLRVDKFLMHRIESVSRNRVQAAADSGLIMVNGEPVKSSYRVKPLDVITVMMPEPQRVLALFAQDIPLEIIHEDDHLLVINKPAGMVVHPAFGNYSGTLVNALMHHLKDAMERHPDVSPYLVHRIDKDTSGLIVVAKNEQAQSMLQKQFFFHTILREYEALVWGDVKNDEGTIEGNIARSRSDRKIFRVYEEEGVGKHAITHYKVLERFGYVTRIQCRLETGRTHQIRVHMKYLGHPLFSDETYGGDKILRGTTFSKYQQFVQNCFKVCPRQALHARSLGFVHPATQEAMYFAAEPPEDMRLLLEKWKNYAIHKTLDEE